MKSNLKLKLNYLFSLLKFKIATLPIRLWLYILSAVQRRIDNRILTSKEVYVVYFSTCYQDIFVCPDGESALNLVNKYKELNVLTNRQFVQVLYGKASTVFTYKLPVLLNLVFTWNASEEERRKIYDQIIETPFKSR